MKPFLAACILSVCLCGTAAAQIPRIGAEEEAIRKRNKIKYRQPQQPLIEIEGGGVNTGKKEGTLLQPLRGPAAPASPPDTQH